MHEAKSEPSVRSSNSRTRTVLLTLGLLWIAFKAIQLLTASSAERFADALDISRPSLGGIIALGSLIASFFVGRKSNNNNA